MIFILTANFGLTFHKDNPYFPRFEEMLFILETGDLMKWNQEDGNMTNPIPFVDADYDLRCIPMLQDLFYSVE
jgi:hypothetical protein